MGTPVPGGSSSRWYVPHSQADSSRRAALAPEAQPVDFDFEIGLAEMLAWFRTLPGNEA